MTEVMMRSVDMPSGKSCYSVRATGHATGEPVLCAAISTLIGSLQGWLYASGAILVVDEVDSGRAELVFRGKGCDTAYDLVACGMVRLKKAYGDKFSLFI